MSMQINQCNHEWLSSTLGVSNFLDPMENILCGIYIISGHLEKTDGKKEPVCYDFVDDSQYLVKSFKRRCTTYRKNGCYFVEEDTE